MVSKRDEATPSLGGELFGSGKPERTPASLLPWAIAGVTVLLVLAVLWLSGRHRSATVTNAVLPLDGYASSLPVSGVAMSESTSLSGGKSTFLDGRIQNRGSKMVTAATLQVLFANDESMPPQIETLPLTLIRTRQPYVDTQPVSAAPLAPGEEREFRLIFENIGASWNQQLPEIRIVRVTAH